MIKDLRKASLGYVQWKQTQTHFRKPWRYPEDITVPRILIEDCWDIPSQVEEVEEKVKSNNKIEAVQTPTKSKAIAKSLHKESNGDGQIVNSNSATSSPLPQKKTTKLKKFKFKFEK
jgi:hypothetical protein